MLAPDDQISIRSLDIAEIGVVEPLWNALRERLRPLGLGELSLHVLAGNDDAARFCERHGFSPFATWLRAG